MLKYIGKFEVPVHDFVLDEGLEPVQDLYKVLYCFFLGNVFLFLDVGTQIALVTKLQDEVNVINCFFDVNQTDNVVIFACFENLDLVVQKLCEFT